jgi:hypothetical protein
MQNDDISGLFTCDIGCAKGKIYLISSSCTINVTFKTFLQTLFFTSFCHNPNFQTVSNAFLKSINVQYNFSQTTYIYIYQLARVSKKKRRLIQFGGWGYGKSW